MGSQYLHRQFPTGEWSKPATARTKRTSATGLNTSRTNATRSMNEGNQTQRSIDQEDPVDVWMSQKEETQSRPVTAAELDTLTQAIENKQDLPLNFYLRGECYRRLGYISQAIDDLNQYLELDPFDHNPYFSRGRCFAAVRKFSPALIDFENTFSVQEPVSIETLTNIAMCAYELGDYEKAKKFVLNSLAIESTATAHYWCALIFEALDDKALAEEHFNCCRQMDESLPHKFVQEATTLAQQEDYEGEIVTYTRLLSMFPDWFEIIERRGVAHLNLYKQILQQYEGGARETDEGAKEALSHALNDLTVCINLDTNRETQALFHRGRLFRNQAHAYSRGANDLTIYLEKYMDHDNSNEALVLQADCLVKCGGAQNRKRAKVAYHTLIDRGVSVFDVHSIHDAAYYFFAVRHVRDGEWANAIENLLAAMERTRFTRAEMEENIWLPFFQRAVATDEGLKVEGAPVWAQEDMRTPPTLVSHCVTQIARGDPETKKSLFEARGITEKQMADWLTRLGDAEDAERCVELYKSAHDKKVDLTNSAGCYALQTWIAEDRKANPDAAVDAAAKKKPPAGPVMRPLNALTAKTIAHNTEAAYGGKKPDPLNARAIERLKAIAV